MSCAVDTYPLIAENKSHRTRDEGLTDMTCELLKTCYFMERVSRMEPCTADILKLTYCEKDFHECARYNVSRLLLIPEMDVPDEIWPSDDAESKEWMDQIGKDFCR